MKPAIGFPHPHEHACEFDQRHAHPAWGQASPLTQRIEERRRLVIAAFLVVSTGAVLFTGAFLSNSLALLSDAGEKLSDLSAITIGLLALIFASAPPTARRTFGSYRLEVLAALANGLLVLIVAFWIIYQAVQRLAAPPPVQTTQMFVFALAGLLMNLLTLWILRGGSPIPQAGLALRSAVLDIVSDLLTSVGVVVGAVVMAMTGWTLLDPLLGIIFCGVIIWWAYRLMREAVGVLLEAAPDDVDREGVVKAMREITEIANVHDVHLWTISSGLYALSAHVAVRNMPISETSAVLQTINSVLCDRFRIGHTAIQFEVVKPDR